MVELRALAAYIDDLLEADRFADYCPNGLQVEGRPQVRHLISGVTASLAFLDAAIEAGADAVLVHHGFFWRGEDARVIGMKQRRLRRLLEAQVSLLAYHLPLDAHPLYGNNAQLAERLGFTIEGRFGDPRAGAIGMYGTPARPLSGEALAAHIEASLERTPLHVAGGNAQVRSVAWCTGGAQSYIDAAAALGVDAFITGEVSEPTVHVAREMGLHFYAAGHHATERYGAQALGEHLGAQFGLEHRFIDVDNPA